MTVEPNCTSEVKNLLIAAKPYSRQGISERKNEERRKSFYSDEESESYQEEWVREERVDG